MALDITPATDCIRAAIAKVTPESTMVVCSPDEPACRVLDG